MVQSCFVLTIRTKAGTIDAEGLNLTIETLKQKDDNRLEADAGLVKKVKSNKNIFIREYTEQIFENIDNENILEIIPVNSFSCSSVTSGLFQ